MGFTIYHNPRCSKSRATLAILEEAGIRPDIIEYLKHPPDAATIEHLASLLDCRPQDLIRDSDSDFQRQADEIAGYGRTEAADWLAAHPAALQRPIVVRDDRTAIIGRPPENVRRILRG